MDLVCRRHTLAELLALFQEKYARANYSAAHLLKSLSYFEEAEKDPMPDMLAGFSWEEVKAFFFREAPRLL